ncbi:zinc finger MYM-type protein 1-like [Sipha flava]|uniref:Zinc finger MYM-type protein 1-like n=2 Tax=Sipha flava TaxID=143950 RepID=A0A8B8FHB8_9HEMI|nr:zinc finger MYM-type protein 1-like [Sipha flava]
MEKKLKNFKFVECDVELESVGQISKNDLKNILDSKEDGQDTTNTYTENNNSSDVSTSTVVEYDVGLESVGQISENEFKSILNSKEDGQDTNNTYTENNNSSDISTSTDLNSMLNLQYDFPTDIAKFPWTITDANLIRSLILYGPCKPDINFPVNNNGKRFSSSYYFLTTKSGTKIPRTWLCYSYNLDCVYCESCWLFADRSYGKFKWDWIYGINDWNHLSQSIQRHESSIQHLDAAKIRSIWVKNETIDASLEKQYTDEAVKWRNVLKRLIKIILSITAGNCALRGNEGSLKIKCATEGNFLRTVRLLAEFDPILNDILNDENQKIKYLSWSIQNELLDILSTELRHLICNKIRSSSFFSVILDSTQDITKQDQVSLVIRYTTLDFEKKQIQIKKSFLGFYLLSHHGAANYVELLKNTLMRLDLNIMKYRGQGYDGAAVMSGSITGVQKQICDIVPNAIFVHCCSHNINLVLCDAAKSTRKIQSFFDTVQDIYNLFSSSSPRWAQLAFGEEYGNKINKITLKKVCPTRWEARHNALFSLKHRFVDVLKSLSNIQLSSSKKDEINMATTLKKKNGKC